jgi:hypothetical protein
MSRIVEIFDYWRDYPPLHIMVRSYLGIESQGPPDPLAIAEMMRAMTGSSRAQKLSTAPAIDQERFKALKQMAKQRAR